MLYQYFTTTIPGIKNMFTNLNDKPIFPQYTVSVNRFNPNTEEGFIFFPLFLSSKQTRKAQQPWSLLTGGPTQHQGDA